MSFCSPHCATSILLCVTSPKHRPREPFARGQHLGAAKKKKKRVRRTEGRMGLLAETRTTADGHAVFGNRDVRVFRHWPVAVPPAEFTVRLVHDGLSGSKITVFSHRWGRFYASFTGACKGETLKKPGFCGAFGTKYNEYIVLFWPCLRSGPAATRAAVTIVRHKSFGRIRASRQSAATIDP